MSTELTLAQQPSQFLALRDDESGTELREALEANLSGGEGIDRSMITSVKVPSGGGSLWEVPTITGTPEGAAEIVGVFCYKSPVISTIWPSEDPSASRPIASSVDGSVTFVQRCKAEDIPDDMIDTFENAVISGSIEEGTAEFDGEQLKCYTEFGTSAKGKGKYAKDSRDVFILRENDAFPICVRISSASLKNARTFLGTLGISGTPYYRAVVALGLEPEKTDAGEPYSRVTFRCVGTITKEQGEAVKRLYENACQSISGA